MEDCCDSRHPDYTKHIPRINKAMGQLNGIKKMIEEEVILRNSDNLLFINS